MAGRASIVGAAATHVGKVREHNEDAHFFDADAGVFLVCDGMGGHAAGEVASALAIRTIRSRWSEHETIKLVDAWLDKGSFDAKKQMLGSLRAGVVAAHDAILAEAERDESKSGMGTTLVGAMIVGNELVFAHAGDSRAYLVRDSIAMQLTEDHTLLARLLAAGIDVDVSGEGSRFRSMLTNALGIGTEVKVSTFVVPLADGDRFLLCSDGISEYVKEAEVGEVLSKQPSPARAAQKLIELALERGGGDNATAIVVRVLEAGETPQPADHIKRDLDVIASCPLWGEKLTPQQRLRALRIAIPRDQAIGERIPANTLGDRVAWIVVDGKAAQDGKVLEPGALIYPESLVADSQAPDREGLAVARTDVRLLALRADDFRELCDDDNELGEALLEALQPLITHRRKRTTVRVGRDRADSEIETAERAALPAAESEESTKPEGGFKRRITGDEDTLDEDEDEDEDPQAQRKTLPIRPPSDLAPARTAVERPHGKQAVPGSIEEALTARVESELDARFDAVFAGDESPAPLPKPRLPRDPPVPRVTPPSGERVPLILKPRAPTDPGSLRIPAPPARAITDPPIAAGTSPQLQRAPTPRPRPPTDPEIETVIELEAESPPDEPAADDDAPEVIVVREEPADDAFADDARVTESVTDSSAPVITMTVGGDDDEPEITRIEPDDESGPNVRPLSEPNIRVSGSISSDKDRSPPRSKRLSEGWDD